MPSSIQTALISTVSSVIFRKDFFLETILRQISNVNVVNRSQLLDTFFLICAFFMHFKSRLLFLNNLPVS